MNYKIKQRKSGGIKMIKITDGTTVLEYYTSPTVVGGVIVDCYISGKFYQSYEYSLQEFVDDITYRLSNNWKEVE
jgi:hypothetical protein